MKSYNHLWERFISDEIIEESIKGAKRGKTDRNSVKEYLNDPNLKEKVREFAEHFHNYKHNPVEIYDGIQRKKRTIIVPAFMEQIIHHMIVNTLKPIFLHGMYEHSYGSIPNRGAHKGMKVIKKWIAHDRKNCAYCLKMDIRKYFESIPHDIYLRKLREIIHDDKFMAILEEITRVIPHGIPLGFYTSQWTANWYLQELDHFIKENLGAVHYMRYMDDMVIFGPDKESLHHMRAQIAEFLRNELGLEMKDNWQVFLFDRPYYRNGKLVDGRFLDFMGFRFYRNRVVLRKSIMLKATRKAKRLYHMAKITLYAAKQMLSYLGWIKCTSTYNMYLERIKPYIDFQYLKRRISKYDKRENRRVKDYELAQSGKYGVPEHNGHNIIQNLQLCAS